MESVERPEFVASTQARPGRDPARRDAWTGQSAAGVGKSRYPDRHVSCIWENEGTGRGATTCAHASGRAERSSCMHEQQHVWCCFNMVFTGLFFNGLEIMSVVAMRTIEMGE